MDLSSCTLLCVFLSMGDILAWYTPSAGAVRYKMQQLSQPVLHCGVHVQWAVCAVCEITSCFVTPNAMIAQSSYPGHTAMLRAPALVSGSCLPRNKACLKSMLQLFTTPSHCRSMLDKSCLLGAQGKCREKTEHLEYKHMG